MCVCACMLVLLIIVALSCNLIEHIYLSVCVSDYEYSTVFNVQSRNFVLVLHFNYGPVHESVENWNQVRGLTSRGQRRWNLKFKLQKTMRDRHKNIIGNQKSQVFWLGAMYYFIVWWLLLIFVSYMRERGSSQCCAIIIGFNVITSWLWCWWLEQRPNVLWCILHYPSLVLMLLIVHHTFIRSLVLWWLSLHTLCFPLQGLTQRWIMRG